MEKAGTGIKRVKDACDANDNKISFEFTDAFWITIYSNHVSEADGQKVVEKVVENLTMNQIMIIELIGKNHQISARELAIELGISHRKTQENMAKLKEIGWLKRIGSAKGGHWRITNKPS